MDTETKMSLGVVTGLCLGAIVSTVKGLVIEPEEESITIDHFKDEDGDAITSITEKKPFWVIGYLKQNGTAIPNIEVWVYRTDSAGNPITPFERNSGNTNEVGRYVIGFVAVDVTESTPVYFRAYDDVQKPT